MIDLTDFLLARIAEDEAAAREAFELPADARWCEHWMQTGIRHLVRNCDIECLICNDDDWCGGPARTAGTHIARHDPARVLAECEAKRRIVGQWREVDEIRRKHDDDPDLYCELADGHVIALDQVLRHLAMPYADHPDYDEAWRP